MPCLDNKPKLAQLFYTPRRERGGWSESHLTDVFLPRMTNSWSFKKAEISQVSLLPFLSPSKHPKSGPWSEEIKAAAAFLAAGLLHCLVLTTAACWTCWPGWTFQSSDCCCRTDFHFSSTCMSSWIPLTYIAHRSHMRLPGQDQDISSPETDVTMNK